MLHDKTDTFWFVCSIEVSGKMTMFKVLSGTKSYSLITVRLSSNVVESVNTSSRLAGARRTQIFCLLIEMIILLLDPKNQVACTLKLVLICDSLPFARNNKL